MAPASVSSPSEGEIVESDTDKATKSLVEPRNISVDRQSRQRSLASRSPTPIRSPRRRSSRSRSRSPYRASRGPKRQVDDDHYDRSRNDSRRFKISHDDRHYGYNAESRRAHRDPVSGNSRKPHHHSRYSNGRSYDERSRKKSQSPDRRHDRDFKDRHLDHRDDQKRYRTGHSPGEGGATSMGTSSGKGRTMETISSPQGIPGQGTDQAQGPMQKIKYVASPIFAEVFNNVSYSRQLGVEEQSSIMQPAEEKPIDEAALIEERRKRREAIKARFKKQNDVPLVQTAVTESASRKSTPNLNAPGQNSQVQDTPTTEIMANRHNADALHSSQTPTLGSPSVARGRDSPQEFVVTKDSDLINSNTLSPNHAQGDEPSAADYDPTMDMQEDKLRYDEDHGKVDVTSGMDGLMADTQPVDSSLNRATVVPKGKKNSDLDMFGDDDELDMFAESTNAPPKAQEGQANTEVLPQIKALNVNMIDDWDDPDGYYKVILGELLDNRYQVQSNLGKGMFSGVVRAMDQKIKRVVAIKIVRNNETMRKAGLQEIEVLQKLSSADPDDKKHLVRLERHFEHKGHLCMVFENLSIDLREVLKKFGRDVGINLKAVREYARQMFLGLSLLRKCNILHADLKPDNILVNESRTTLKVCDLGSAADASEGEITRYLVSRFYRAPEIILGLPYDFAIDMWSIGCTLFELYTGKILFTGRSNNQMLRAIMECRGKFNPKLVRKAEFARLYFDDLLNFRSIEKDKLTGKDVTRMLNFNKPTRDLKTRLLANVKGVGDAELRDLNLFVDLLDRCLNLNPEKRCTPTEALKHPFIMRAKG